MTDALWTSDFTLRGKAVQVKKTGAEVVIDRALAAEVASWFALYLAIRARALVTRLAAPGPKVWFAPDQPRPWYLVWAAASWAGVRVVDDPMQAQAAFYFDDTTTGEPPAVTGRAFNFACRDITKSRVAEVFEDVFGYPLAVDPDHGQGLAVEKGEANGVHDGRMVWLPTLVRPGKVYQRLIDNIEGENAVDLRTPFVGGRPVVVFVKRRPIESRFANHNSHVALARPKDVFSKLEIVQLSAFARAMGLDWGGLDVLRDGPSGRLYVVDVNKTDMGPPTALPFHAKLKAVALLARAFEDLVKGGARS